MVAAHNGNKEIIKILIQAGANIELTSNVNQIIYMLERTEHTGCREGQFNPGAHE
jgi:Ankyrin repeat